MTYLNGISSCDIGNPAYDSYRDIGGIDEIVVPIFNEDGDVIEHEEIKFWWTEGCGEVQVMAVPFKAHRDDVHDELYKKFKTHIIFL